MSSREFLSSYRWASSSPPNLLARGSPSQGETSSTARADCMEDPARTARKPPPAVQAPRLLRATSNTGSESKHPGAHSCSPCKAGAAGRSRLSSNSIAGSVERPLSHLPRTNSAGEASKTELSSRDPAS